jgi:hypothetical protein
MLERQQVMAKQRQAHVYLGRHLNVFESAKPSHAGL